MMTLNTLPEIVEEAAEAARAAAKQAIEKIESPESRLEFIRDYYMPVIIGIAELQDKLSGI